MTWLGSIRVRPATLEDCSSIGEVHVTAWKETYRGMVPDSMLAALSVGQREEVWRRILSQPFGPNSTRVYVAAAGSRITGFSSCGPQRSEDVANQGYDGEISAIYVVRSFQRLGLGRALFEIMGCDLREIGNGKFSLWVLRENTRARTFYEHLGGQLVAERQDARSDGVLHEVAYGWRHFA